MDECSCGNNCPICEGCGEFECECVCGSFSVGDDDEFNEEDEF